VWGSVAPAWGMVCLRAVGGTASHRLGIRWCRGALSCGWAMAPLLLLGWGWAMAPWLPLGWVWAMASSRLGLGNGSMASPEGDGLWLYWLPLVGDGLWLHCFP